MFGTGAEAAILSRTRATLGDGAVLGAELPRVQPSLHPLHTFRIVGQARATVRTDRAFHLVSQEVLTSCGRQRENKLKQRQGQGLF